MDQLDWLPALLDQLAGVSALITKPIGAVVTSVLVACAYGVRTYLKAKGAATSPAVLPPFGAMTDAEKKAAAAVAPPKQ